MRISAFSPTRLSRFPCFPRRAGNAMTSTVVGTCMMAALSLAHNQKLLPAKRQNIKRRPLLEPVQVRTGLPYSVASCLGPGGHP